MWPVILSLILIFVVFSNSLFNNQMGGANGQGEGFISGKEQLATPYFDQLRCLFDPKFITPQQKDFQISLSEHSALDPNMQHRRPEIRTQLCKTGDHCFNTDDFHKINYSSQFKSSPDIISSRVGFEPKPLPVVKHINHQDNYIVPHNSTSMEMRADLFDDIVLPDLYFKKMMKIRRGQTHPDEHVYNTQIY